MTGKFRALLAALILVIAAGLGTWYIAGLQSRSPIRMTLLQGPKGIEVASNGDLNDIFASDSDDAQLLNFALGQLESRYYKPIDPQTPVTGEEQALTTYLKSKHVPDPALPREVANGDESHDAGQLQAVLSYSDAHYAAKLGPNAQQDLTQTALRGIMASVKDPYTVYLSPQEINALTESLSGGDFGGIGVYIEQLKTLQIFVLPIEDMPAAHAGMRPGQVIDTVDGKSVKGLSLDAVEQLIRGDEGTTVHIATDGTITPDFKVKPAPVHRYAITREIIHVPTVHREMMGKNEYIRLSDFGDTSADEMRKALLWGKAKHAKGIILDLRDNGGGLVRAAVDISSYFIPQGTIVSEIDRDGTKTVESAEGNAIGGLAPLVILVNGYTASASEITSGALQDYHLATLIGTKTFGKGVVQQIYEMPDKGALKITVARYLTPLGRDIQHKGIVPDIIVNQGPDPTLIDGPHDKQLAAAKARLAQLNR